MKKKANEKTTRIIGLVLGLILFFLLFILDYQEAYENFNFKIDYIFSVVMEIGDEFVGQDDGEIIWRIAIPVYWFLEWRYRTLIGRAVTIFFKKI